MKTQLKVWGCRATARAVQSGARLGHVFLLAAFLVTGSGCDSPVPSHTFDLKKIVYNSEFTLADLSDGTEVEIYPTYVVIRRPGPEMATVVPMAQIRALDVE